jgi:hypothetical protein
MLGDGKSPYYLKKFTNALVQSSLSVKRAPVMIETRRV